MSAKATKKQVQKAESAFEARRKRAVDDLLWRQPAASGVGGAGASGIVVRDLLCDFAAFQSYTSGDLSMTISFSGPGMASWTPALQAALFDLTKRNMQSIYSRAGPSWTWNDTKKRGELNADVTRCLVVHDAAGALLGFMSFRLLLEGNFEILYIYELQIADAAQRKGLGKRLMQLSELIARKNGLQW